MLPCMLPKVMSDNHLDELAAYSRLKRRIEKDALNVCKKCQEKKRHEMKKCSACGAQYNEEGNWTVADDETQKKEAQTTIDKLVRRGELKTQGDSDA